MSEELDNFDNFMVHQCSTEYISQGFTVDMGDGYTFATDGKAPIVRKLSLTFRGYKWYTNEDGTIDTETNKNINNMGALRDFWKKHLTHKPFIYRHPKEGDLRVRFNCTFKDPEPLSIGFSVVKDFQLELIEMV